MEKYGIDETKIDVVYNGANKFYRPLCIAEKEKVRQQLTCCFEYFIFTGAIQPRKNIANIFKAFDNFKQETGSPMKLVIAGRQAWQFKEILQVFTQMIHKEDIVFIGHQPAEKLAEVTGAATAMVYPSLFEFR